MTIAKISMHGLLQAIASTQPTAGTNEPDSTLKNIKGFLEKEHPEKIVTFTSISHLRTEGIAEGLVIKNGYSYQLSKLGKQELTDLNQKNKTKTVSQNSTVAK